MTDTDRLDSNHIAPTRTERLGKKYVFGMWPYRKNVNEALEGRYG